MCGVREALAGFLNEVDATAREKVKKFPSDRVDIVLSASVTIPDTSGMLHSFSENQTSLETELRVHKRDLVRVDGG